LAHAKPGDPPSGGLPTPLPQPRWLCRCARREQVVTLHPASRFGAPTVGLTVRKWSGDVPQQRGRSPDSGGDARKHHRANRFQGPSGSATNSVTEVLSPVNLTSYRVLVQCVDVSDQFPASSEPLSVHSTVGKLNVPHVLGRVAARLRGEESVVR